MGKTLAIADVRREIQKAITKLRILPSATIAVLPGDHPMRPSVITAPPGGFVVGPTISNDNAIAVFDGVTGDVIQDPGLGVPGDSILYTATLLDIPVPVQITAAMGLTMIGADIFLGGGRFELGGGTIIFSIPDDNQIFQQSSDVVAHTIGGVPILLVKPEGLVLTRSGASGAIDVGLILDGDEDSDIISLIDDVITIRTGGSNRMNIGNSAITMLTQVAISGVLDMTGNDIVGYAPKESHVDFLALVTEEAFS